jgi:hypothetical protein
VISAYPIGQQLRVIARESGFARVQDLGSGHLGWIAEAALVPRMRGYRVREPAPAEPQVVAAAERSPPPRAEPAAPHIKVAAPVAVPDAAHPSRRASRAPIAEPTVPITETGPREDWASASSGGVTRLSSSRRVRAVASSPVSFSGQSANAEALAAA